SEQKRQAHSSQGDQQGSGAPLESACHASISFLICSREAASLPWGRASVELPPGKFVYAVGNLALKSDLPAPQPVQSISASRAEYSPFAGCARAGGLTSFPGAANPCARSPRPTE